jgi:hypothetical protein
MGSAFNLPCHKTNQKDKTANLLAAVIADQLPMLNGPSFSSMVIEDVADMTLGRLRSG